LLFTWPLELLFTLLLLSDDGDLGGLCTLELLLGVVAAAVWPVVVRVEFMLRLAISVELLFESRRARRG
jgi:hypothetical protein